MKFVGMMCVGKKEMEKLLCETILHWQQNHPQEFAINWEDIAVKMCESGYLATPQNCLKLWMQLCYGLEDLVTNFEEEMLSLVIIPEHYFSEPPKPATANLTTNQLISANPSVSDKNNPQSSSTNNNNNNNNKNGIPNKKTYKKRDKDAKNFQCPYCFKAFPNKNAIKRHIENLHSKAEEFRAKSESATIQNKKVTSKNSYDMISTNSRVTPQSLQSQQLSQQLQTAVMQSRPRPPAATSSNPATTTTSSMGSGAHRQIANIYGRSHFPTPPPHPRFMQSQNSLFSPPQVPSGPTLQMRPRPLYLSTVPIQVGPRPLPVFAAPGVRPPSIPKRPSSSKTTPSTSTSTTTSTSSPSS